MSLKNVIHGSEHVSFKVRTAAQGVGSTDIGTKMVIEDGRSYRWTEAGSLPIAGAEGSSTVGELWQAELNNIAVSGDQAIDTLLAANDITVLTGIGSTTTSFAVDDLKDGWVFIDSVANLNPAWRVVSNTAITAAATTGTITIGTAIVDDIAVGETVSFAKNAYKDAIQCPASATAAVAGVAVSVFAFDGFGWLATGGPTRCLASGAVLEGDMVVCSAGVAGSIMPSAALETDGPELGYVVLDQPDTEYFIAFLNFDC